MLELGLFDIEATDDFGTTPLSAAIWGARWGELDIVEHLINYAGVNVHVLNYEAESLLHVAVRAGCLELIRYHIEIHGFDIAAEDKGRRTLIQSALERNHLHVFGFLVNKHLEGSRLEINGQCEFVCDRGYGECTYGRYRCPLGLTKVLADCGICGQITEMLGIRSFYLEDGDALLEKAKGSRPSDWCINPRKED